MCENIPALCDSLVVPEVMPLIGPAINHNLIGREWNPAASVDSPLSWSHSPDTIHAEPLAPQLSGLTVVTDNSIVSNRFTFKFCPYCTSSLLNFANPLKPPNQIPHSLPPKTHCRWCFCRCLLLLCSVFQSQPYLISSWLITLNDQTGSPPVTEKYCVLKERPYLHTSYSNLHNLMICFPADPVLARCLSLSADVLWIVSRVCFLIITTGSSVYG